MATLIKRSSGIYYHILTIGGKRVRKSTGEATKIKAPYSHSGNTRHPF